MWKTLEPPAKLTRKRKLIYDDEWLKKVLNKICPDCDGELKRKGILRYCTTNQHLHIYGNPILVAYKREEPITPQYSLSKECPECKGTSFDYNSKTDETSCRKCGLVLSGPPCYGVNYPWHVSYSDVITYIALK